MELTKQWVENLRFRNKRGKYYWAKEVDDALDEIAEAVESQQNEIVRLQQTEREYLAEKAQIGEILIKAKKLTEQCAEQERQRQTEERKAYEAAKLRLVHEIQTLEQKKAESIDAFKREIQALKLSIDKIRTDNKAAVTTEKPV